MTVKSRPEYFTVDAKLLRELGERLVGRPHIALAELIKNAYDADARLVEVKFARDRIEIVDDGHGMSEDALLGRWMRVGTTRKEAERRSPELGRSMTGSKGVGRLSAQVLASEMTLVSVGLKDATILGKESRRSAAWSQLEEGVRAHVRWRDAIASGDLTSVAVDVSGVSDKVRFADGSVCGTRVILTGLQRRWDAAQFRRLAEQVWHLQPPFGLDTDPDAFVVRLDSKHANVVEEFDRQMRAVFDIYTAKITAEIRADDDSEAHVFELPSRLRPESEPTAEGAADDEEDGEPDAGGAVVPGVRQPAPFPGRLIDITVELRDGETRTTTYRMPECRLHQLEYEIRVFHLQNRQPAGVTVGQARAYLDTYGGVGIYDGGFRLPYYGADQDWIEINSQSAARLSASKLVPEELAVPRGLQDLPTSRRLYGAVRVSTGAEAAAAAAAGQDLSQALAVQVTRDRFVGNEAYEQLRVLVRAGLDLYAMERARTRFDKTRKKRNAPDARPASEAFGAVRDALDQASELLPSSAYSELRSAVNAAIETAGDLEESSRAHAGLLGALATAGMTSIAYEHEIEKQLAALSELGDDLRVAAGHLDGPVKTMVERAERGIGEWLARARGIRGVFSALMDEETRTSVDNYSARTLANEVKDQLRVLAGAAYVDTSRVPASLRLPLAAYPAWSAILQNLYVNAFNAVLDRAERRVVVDGTGGSATGWLRVQDTGRGVDLDDADRLFEPFQRGTSPSRERASLALGGAGLGLTIVRMIADELGCNVRFEPPEDGFSTAIRISWRGLP